MPAALSAGGLGNVAFFGDSITHGSHNNQPVDERIPSWRYSFWKNLIDSGYSYNDDLSSPKGDRDFEFVGVRTDYTKMSAGLPALAKDYGGQKFHNIHSSFGSATTGDFVNNADTGKSNWNNWEKKEDGYMGNWLCDKEGNAIDARNPLTGADYNAPTGQPLFCPDTVVIMIGTNDAGSAAAGNNLNQVSDVVANIREMVDICRQANPDATINLVTMPSGGVNKDSINNLLLTEGLSWSTASSKVNVINGNVGFDSSRDFMTYDGTHPNAQGGLILAGNIAQGMGIGQRTAGCERAEAFTSHAFQRLNMTKVPDGYQGRTEGLQVLAGKQSSYLNLQSSKVETGQINVLWSDAKKNVGFTVEISLQLNAQIGSSESNVFSIGLSDQFSERGGLLNIYEDKVTWGSSGKVLYVLSNVSDVNDFRVVFVKEDASNGIMEGFYVWRNGMMIGEALQGDQSLSGTQGISLGDLSLTDSTYAGIQSISFSEEGYAPGELVGPIYDMLGGNIPEPSSIMLGGLGFLCLSLTRRRKVCR